MPLRLGASAAAAVTRSFTIDIPRQEGLIAQAEGDVLHALRTELRAAGVSRVEQARVQRVVSMEVHVTGEGMTSEAWNERDGGAFLAFRAELAERLNCREEDIVANVFSLTEGGVSVSIEVRDPDIRMLNRVV